jgi:hypothetical protein
MYANTTTIRSREKKGTLRRGISILMRLIRLTFISGPKQLLTSRISVKCASIMIIMCAPSLLFCSLLTFPALIFTSPNQNAYFHFSKMLDQDPTRWIVLTLAGICAIISLAIPATMTEPIEIDTY